MINKEKNNHPKIGLALSGGSALGMAHIGVIKSLSENSILIDCVSGTSAGAIAAACLAFEVPLEKMIEISKKINWSNISEFGYSKFGLNSNRPISEMIIEIMGDVKIEDAKIPLAIVATDIDTGEEVIFHEGNLTEAIMASTCLPGIFVPVEVKGKRLVDGGLIENLPLSPLKKMGAKIRIGVNLKHWNNYKKTSNVFDVISNSYNILSRSQDYSIANQAEIIIEPRLGKFDSSDFEKFDALLEEGYKASNRMIPKIKKYLNQDISNQNSFFQKIVNFFKLKIKMNKENKFKQENDIPAEKEQAEAKNKELVPTWLGFVIAFLVLAGLFLLFTKFKSITTLVQ
jgi:NTE family protein